MKNERKYILVFTLLGLAVTTVLAFSISYNVVPIETYGVYLNQPFSKIDGIVAHIRWLIQENDILLTVLTYFVFILYLVIFFKHRKPWCRSRIILAVIYSLLSVIGKCFKDGGNLDFFLCGIGHFVLCSIFGISYFMFYYSVLTVLDWSLEKRSIMTERGEQKTHILERHSKFCTFIFVCICQLPNMYFFFPGIVNWDGLRQLDFWIGSLEWTTHHPVFSTIIMGVFFEIGKYLGGSDYFGFFLYISIQIILHAILVAISVDMLKNWKINIRVRIIIVLFYSLFSVWQIYLITFIKDTSYYLAVWWFIICLIKTVEMINYKQEIPILTFVFFTVAGFLVCMFRNDGIFVVIPIIIIIIIKFKQYRKKYIISIMTIIGGIIVINTFLASAIGIQKGDIKEALSIPFQQTARYVKEYSDEVTEHERQIIDKLLKYDELAERYNPDISDAVKGSRFDFYDKKDLVAYFKVWWKQMFKHPICYIESFLNSSYRYWYIGALQYEKGICTYTQVTSNYVDRGDFKFEFINDRINGRKMIENLDNIEYGLPIITLLYRPATYIWLLLLCIYFIRRGGGYIDKLIVCFPLIMCFFINMASPVNGSIRYALPIMACMPLIFIYSVRST